jgi:hypothetical protein
MMRLYLRHKNVSHTPQNHDETRGVVVPSVCSNNTPRTRTTLTYLKFKAKLIEVHQRKNKREIICKRFFNCRSHQGDFKECEGNRKMKMDVIERTIIQILESEKVKRDVNSSDKFN